MQERSFLRRYSSKSYDDLKIILQISKIFENFQKSRKSKKNESHRDFKDFRFFEISRFLKKIKIFRNLKYNFQIVITFRRITSQKIFAPECPMQNCSANRFCMFLLSQSHSPASYLAKPIIPEISPKIVSILMFEYKLSYRFSYVHF